MAPFRQLVVVATLFFLGIFSSTPVSAVPFSAAASSRGSFSTSGVDSVSYDGHGFDAFVPFLGATSTDVLRFDQITGAAGGSRLDFFLLSEVAAYDGVSIPGVGDAIGVIDSGNNFISALDPSTTPGAVGSLILAEGQDYALGLQSPEGLFSAVDANNPDGGTAHLIGLQVTHDFLAFIQKANLWGMSLMFQLLEGDYIVFGEDLLTSGNMLEGGLAADFDYNDVVFVIRHTQIPEPGTLGLLAAAFGVGAWRRRRNRASKELLA